MAVRVAEVLRTVAPRVALVRRGAPDGHPWVFTDHTPIEVIREADDGERHPLWGVASALRAARTARAILAPCDVPGLSADAVRRLAAHPGSVTLRDAERAHPSIGVFTVEEADRAEVFARAGRSVRSFVADLPTVEVGGTIENLNRMSPTLDRQERLESRLGWLEVPARRRALEAEAARRLAVRGAWIPWAAEGGR